jgi:hypothetical protein
MATYRVRLGGSPEDSGEVFSNADDAEDAAVEMAVERAFERGDNADSVALYGGPRCPSWGACPDGDEGGYYPIIAVEE